jgi:hypothetical protein
VADPGDGGLGASVGRLDVSSRARGGVLSGLGSAPVDAQPVVAELAAQRDGEHVVGRAVYAEVWDGRVAPVAAGELGTGDDGHAGEVLCHRVVSQKEKKKRSEKGLFSFSS